MALKPISESTLRKRVGLVIFIQFPTTPAYKYLLVSTGFFHRNYSS
jgi:hypothetical protein